MRRRSLFPPRHRGWPPVEKHAFCVRASLEHIARPAPLFAPAGMEGPVPPGARMVRPVNHVLAQEDVVRGEVHQARGAAFFVGRRYAGHGIRLHPDDVRRTARPRARGSAKP
jgi:hypothetical protein